MRPLPTAAVRRARLRPAAVAAALTAVLLPLLLGCSSGGPGTRDTAPPAAVPAGGAGSAVGAAATSSPAAELQAGLTALLVERTALLAEATRAVVDTGSATGARPAAALAALDDASAALADVLGATYREAREPVLEALRGDDRLLAEHAVALAAGDAERAAAVRVRVGVAQARLAEVLRRVVPALDAAELAGRLSTDLQVQAAITGPQGYLVLRDATRGAAETARLLAAGVAADRGLGSPGTGAARLRADLTALLTEHVGLVAALGSGGSPGTAGQAGGTADTGARAALQANADEVADLVGGAYPVLRAPFLRSWTAHLDRLAVYAAGGDAGPVRGYPTELGVLLAEHVRGLPSTSATTELDPALTSLLEAVDAAGTPRGASALRDAVADVQRPAAFLSAAIAEDLRLA